MNDKRLPLIYDQTYENINEMMVALGEPTYRSEQLWKGLYQQYWNHPEEFSNLSKSLRTRLAEQYSFTNLKVGPTAQSVDGETIKTVFFLPDNQAIEAVLMRYKKRRTLCISTQAGCAMGCVFCATGQMGLFRNLSSGEIIEQVLYYARQLAGAGERVTNVVMMGMGEPFHNYDQTLQAIDRLGDPRGYNFGARRFTISTVGLIPYIQRFTKERRQVNLAISLHAVDDRLRNSLIPINKKYPVNSLFEASKQYVEATNRRITFEWALINGVNDTPEQAEKLAHHLQSFRRQGSTLCHVNLIPLNPTDGFTGKATTNQNAQKFKAILEQWGIPCTVRIRRGLDIQAGCGQLATKTVNPLN